MPKGVLRPHFEVPDSECRGIVVLVHGLFYRGLLMRPLGRYFAKRHYRVYIYDYATTRSSVEKHGERFRNYLRKLIDNIPASLELNIISHSMGGLLARWALVDEELTSHVNAVVMFAPPNAGSPVASAIIQRHPWVKWLIRSLEGLQDVPGSSVHHIPKSNISRLGIIIARDDQLVMPESTRLPNAQYCTVDTKHREILYYPLARKKCVDFLKNGVFN